MANKLNITLKRSLIGSLPKQRKTMEALGLKKINQAVELPDNGSTRGMIKLVEHLVEVKEA
ncbi:50S ribosomal protein L30 [Isachenkonia alkalipeptolytica]|uniref:Large ribosomal subunit protein uL30 n=1 Tax=Isachenkonia alkalipeptolytica TaxID=2565777 RepID=A0AA43XLM7_9CLOT|nr:50S ribosomal protein L30 [Isachenkonia alkalipeptolytica]NBG88997.1 50S ribosomal protein L30 [Isachenkonia alkalipeptolytica]